MPKGYGDAEVWSHLTDGKVDALFDSDGHLQVDVLSGGGGGTQYTEADTDASITGTAILWEDASNTLRAVSAAKPLPVEVTDASIAVTGTFWQTTQPVSLATVPSHAVTQGTASSLKCEEASASDIKTAVQTIDNCIAGNEAQVDLVGSVPAGTAIIGAVKRDIVNYTKVWKYVALANTNETTIWDPTGGTKFVATDIMVSATAAGTCTLRDGTAGSTIWIASLAANGGFVTNLQTPIQSATADNILTAQAGAATQYVFVSGYEV